ncbi:integrin alpha [Pseudomonadota bacterium]
MTDKSGIKPDTAPLLKPKLLPQAIRSHLATTAAVCFAVGTTPLANAFDSLVNVNALDGSNGFRLINSRVGARPGPYIGGAGDINGDGIDDLIVGSPGDPNDDPPGSYNASGRAYVLFGQTAGFNAEIDLNLVGSGSTLPEATPGFRIVGDAFGDIGVAVSAAGDINGDNIDDLIISAPLLNTTWVVFGKTTGFGSSLNVSDLEGGGAGFRLNGQTDTFSGFSISNAGDVNNDTYDDIIIGQDELRERGGGKAFVVFGGPELNAATTVDLTSLDGTDGFCIHGQLNFVPDDAVFWSVPSAFGASVSGAGDVNGDGFDDVIVGAPYDLPGYNSNLPALINPYYYGGYGSGSYYFPWNAYAGSAYVVFGAASFDPCDTAPIIASDISGAAGFRINGRVFSDALGASVSGAGDINADGIDDLIVGVPGYVPPNDTQPRGRALVIFGSTGLNSVSGPQHYRDGFNIDANDKLQFTGLSVSDAGDVNGDGIDDVIVGSPGPAAGLGDLVGAPGYAQSAKSHVVFGQTTLVKETSTSLTAIDNSGGVAGFRVGDLMDTRLGYSVHSAGDINGDGVDDIITGAPRNTAGTDANGVPFTDGGNDVSYVVLGEGPENPCGTSTTLTGGEWKMVGVPCDPGAANSLADVFGPSLGVGNYQATWVAYTWDNSTVTPAYRALTLADTLSAGDGLWLYSTVNAPLQVSSGTRKETAPIAVFGSTGFYEAQLENPPIPDLEASVFNLIGFPTANTNRVSPPWYDAFFETNLGALGGNPEVLNLSQTTSPYDFSLTHSSTYWIWNAGNGNYDAYSPTTPGLLPPGEIKAYDAIWVETFCCFNTTLNVGFVLPISP